MGNMHKVGPQMEKIIFKGENSNLRYGVCEMQGWRKHMVNIFLINRKMPLSLKLISKTNPQSLV